MNDKEILENIENILIQLRKIKQYVIEQKQLMDKNYAIEVHGRLVLNYLDKVLLKFVKLTDDEIELK